MKQYYKLIPVLFLLSAVIYFYNKFSTGIRAAWQEIAPIITLRDIKLIMNAIEKEYINTGQFPDPNQLKEFITNNVVLKDRIIRSDKPWEDIWGTPFRFLLIEKDLVILQSAGPDRKFSETISSINQSTNDSSPSDDDISYITDIESILKKQKN